MARDLRATRPDHIAVTGDVTQLGLPGEFQEARQWLNHLGRPSQVTVIPGNHDTYIAEPRSQTLDLWREYMASDEGTDIAFGTTSENRGFPLLRIRNGIAMIGVSTAMPAEML